MSESNTTELIDDIFGLLADASYEAREGKRALDKMDATNACHNAEKKIDDARDLMLRLQRRLGLDE